MDKTDKVIQAAIEAGAFVIQQTPPAECSMCHEMEELRPYGPGGAWVCFDCGMKDEAEAKRQFEKVLNGNANKPGKA